MHIALGSTLEGALKKVGYLAPSMTQVWRWLDEHEEFRVKYERARQLQADTLADKSLDITNEVLKNPKDVAAYRLAMDIFKWHSEIRNPKTYNKALKSEEKSAPLDAVKIKSEIKRLEAELGIVEVGNRDKSGNVSDMNSKLKKVV